MVSAVIPSLPTARLDTSTTVLMSSPGKLFLSPSGSIDFCSVVCYYITMIEKIKNPPAFKTSYYIQGKLQIKKTLISYAEFYARWFAYRALVKIETKLASY